jgi:hypothetical protein
MIIQDIARFILGHSGLVWTLGVDFFAGYLPIKDMNDAEIGPRVMVILERTPGAVEGYLPDRVDKAIQVWNRSDTYFGAAEDAREIYEILHGASGWHLPAEESPRAYYAMTIDAIADPAPIAAPNARGLFEFSTNYIFRIEGEPATP